MQGVEQAGVAMSHPTAVECSFMAPGFGPAGHPNMAPYVDERLSWNNSEHPNGYIELGLQWHPKMLIRAELTGVVINGHVVLGLRGIGI